jgi:thiol-disulfide isomerase/thioredoxin
VVAIVLGLVVLVAVIAVVASQVSQHDDDASTEGLQQVAPVAVEGAVLAPLPQGGDDGAVGTAAPSLEGRSFDGTPITIGADGRPKVIIFLAHWCPHCQAEVPKLVEWFGANGVPSDVDVYGVATGTDKSRPNFPPSAWLEREGWDRPTMVDSADSTAAQAFGLSSYPFFVGLDGDNQVVTRGSGELSTGQWEALLDAVRG